MNKTYKKVLEKRIEAITNLENVEIVLPKVVKMDAPQSIDRMLLEMENKRNVRLNAKTPRQLRKEAKAATRSRIQQKAITVVDTVMEAIEDPSKLRKIKPIGAVHDYFFMPDHFYEEEVEAPETTAAIQPVTIKQGKVIRHNFRNNK